MLIVKGLWTLGRNMCRNANTMAVALLPPSGVGKEFIRIGVQI